jgi:hypothetical protein
MSRTIGSPSWWAKTLELRQTSPYVTICHKLCLNENQKNPCDIQGKLDIFRVAGKQGFEPRFHDPESCVHTDLSPFVTSLRMLSLLFHLLNYGRQSKVFTNFPRKDR